MHMNWCYFHDCISDLNDRVAFARRLHIACEVDCARLFLPVQRLLQVQAEVPTPPLLGDRQRLGLPRMQARQLLQGLRAALQAVESRSVALRRSDGLACQLRAADHCGSAWESPCRWMGSLQLLEVSPAANRSVAGFAINQRHQPAQLAQHQATAAVSVCRSAGVRVSPAVAQQATRHASLHTASSRRSADGASSSDPAQGRQPVPGINPLQMSPAAVAGTIGSPAAAVPQPAASAAAASEPRRARAIARNLSISPQKLNDFATVIRRMHVQDAVLQCRYSVKKAAKIVEKARACRDV